MKSLQAILLATVIVPLAASEAAAGSVVLTGPDNLDGAYTPSQIAAEATGANTVNFGGLTGITLWSFLGGSDTTTSTTNSSGTTKNYGQIVTFNPTGANSNPNFDLRYYVVGSGGNGAQTAVSLGQIDPGFVGTASPVPFVAFQTTGGSLLPTPQLVIPNGPAGSTIQNLTSLQLGFVPALPQGPGGQSKGVTITGNVGSPNTTYTQFPGGFTPTTLNVLNSSNQITDTYTGIPLATLLNVPASVGLNGQIVVASATDGYQVVYSLDELLNADGSANPNALLAYAATGTDFPGDGIARTITGQDGPFKHGRWVSNVLELDVESAATPVPAALPLFVTGLGALGLFGWRRKARRSVKAA
ncbi:MAG TPA: hypothetical protein VK438_01270 [Xanthobacteraceae bacterium]|nr:hypothetical protein [Xanthobacteraceae bacterium]